MDQLFNLILFPVSWAWGKVIRWLTRMFRDMLVSSRSLE
jgi:hypothetical protein